MKMKKGFGLFKKLDINLRTEVIINISLLMLAAILLIGFTISKINERRIIQEKIKNGEGMVQDVQSIIDFLSRDKRDFALHHPKVREEIQEFIQIYLREKGYYDLLITDQEMRLIASKRMEGWGKPIFNEWLKKSIQTGQLLPQIEQSGGFLTSTYKKITFYSPLWNQGKIVGGIQLEVPIGDVMVHLLESQRLILTFIILDSVILIVFGSFLLSRVLVKPLKELVRLTQKISDGDFTQKIEVTSKNEIGQLISSFNKMIDRLRENQEDLEKYLESLESTNKKLKQAQEELIRSEKLASIGRFAAGVAHEVGNPLGAILGYTSLLEGGEVSQEEARDYLKRIEKEIERINRIVRELLDFAKPSKVEANEIDVNKVIEQTLSLLSYQKGFKNIQTRLDLQPDLPKIRGNDSQLSQVFINIILNAVDAMPEGGFLTIRTDQLIVEDHFPSRYKSLYPPRRKGDPKEADYSHLRKPDPLSVIFTKFSKGDRLVSIRISDTGIGIGREDIEKIFDPFFTTKAPDKGTGLGLSVSLRIIESMGGDIRVESEVGKGTTFEVYFPVVA